MGARWPWLTETPVPLERSVKALSGRECCTRSLRNSFCGGLSYSVLPGRALPTTRCGGRQETTFKFLNRPSGSQPASRFLCNISAFGALPQRGKAVYCTRAQLPAQAAKPSLATQLLVRAEQEIQNKGKHAKSPPNSSTTSLAAISWSSLSYTRVPVLVRLCCTLPVAKKMGAQGWRVAKLPVIPDSVD